jgi:CheY-like chemotaxis protein
MERRAPELPAALAGRTVLVVEDEYVIAAELREWLRDAGAEVVGPVASPEDALMLIGEADGALDAAVLDVNLGGGMTAFAVAERLERLGVPFLFASGDGEQAAARGFHARPRLEKPVSEQELLRALGQMLGVRPPLPLDRQE